MFFMKDDMIREEKVELRGGKGTLQLCHIVPPELLHGSGTQVGILTIKPGDSIGLHSHSKNFEIYYLLEGTARVTDGGEERILHAGDGELCADGNTHSLENIGETEVRLLAVILNDIDARK
ncbi:MAG: cupin domain-containing protein [Oscillospiraceae bacterium]|nr:cupin domain-containing protein [Oscillospiraceae bacterium]